MIQLMRSLLYIRLVIPICLETNQIDHDTIEPLELTRASERKNKLFDFLQSAHVQHER